jgi:tRNA acetyltransferase TAN1
MMGTQHLKVNFAKHRNRTTALPTVEYDFNLLVSCPWGVHHEARSEIRRILARLGDNQPDVRMTLARGIIGVKTPLDSRSVILALRKLFEEDPSVIQNTLKWVPIDTWTDSSIQSIKQAVARLKGVIDPSETWRMTVETRRYTALHKIDIIREAAELIDQRVNLRNPDRIVRIDVIASQAGVSVLKPDEVFSVTKAKRPA